MGYFTYRNARKAAVRSGRTERMLAEHARQDDGSGYQDSEQIGADIASLVVLCATFVLLPVIWSARVFGVLGLMGLLAGVGVGVLLEVGGGALAAVWLGGCVLIALLWRGWG